MTTPNTEGSTPPDPRTAPLPLGEYMTTREVPQGTTGRKTRTWEVRDRHGGMLGYVEWSGVQRQYVLSANPAIFSTGCLTDLVQFIARANTEHASARAYRKARVDAMLDLTDALAYVRRLIHEYQAGGNAYLLCNALDRIDTTLGQGRKASEESQP